MILLHALLGSTLAIVLLVPIFDSIPRRQDELAWLDGLDSIRLLVLVHVRRLSGVVIAVFALSVVRSWNELLFAGLLTDREVRVFPCIFWPHYGFPH